MALSLLAFAGTNATRANDVELVAGDNTPWARYTLYCTSGGPPLSSGATQDIPCTTSGCDQKQAAQLSKCLVSATLGFLWLGCQSVQSVGKQKH